MFLIPEFKTSESGNSSNKMPRNECILKPYSILLKTTLKKRVTSTIGEAHIISFRQRQGIDGESESLSPR